MSPAKQPKINIPLSPLALRDPSSASQDAGLCSHPPRRAPVAQLDLSSGVFQHQCWKFYAWEPGPWNFNSSDRWRKHPYMEFYMQKASCQTRNRHIKTCELPFFGAVLCKSCNNLLSRCTNFPFCWFKGGKMWGFRCGLSALIRLGKGKFGQMTPERRASEVRVSVCTCALDPGLRSSAQQLEAMLFSDRHRSRRATNQL